MLCSMPEDAEMSLKVTSSKGDQSINQSSKLMEIPEPENDSSQFIETMATTNDASFENNLRERSHTTHPQLTHSGEFDQQLADPIALARLNQTSKDDLKA